MQNNLSFAIVNAAIIHSLILVDLRSLDWNGRFRFHESIVSFNLLSVLLVSAFQVHVRFILDLSMLLLLMKFRLIFSLMPFLFLF